uniref:Uncharacterized protein n=1 Tax=Anguilla anguilla TaxID=7936 RepID=A0A0E9XG93_ANGAN
MAGAMAGARAVSEAQNVKEAVERATAAVDEIAIAAMRTNKKLTNIIVN